MRSKIVKGFKNNLQFSMAIQMHSPEIKNFYCKYDTLNPNS